MQSYGGSIEINSVDRVAPLRAIVIAMLFIIGIVAVATLRTTTIRNGARSLSEFRLSAVLTPSVLDQIEARTPSPHGRLSRARMQGSGKLTVEGMRGLSGQIEKQAPSPAIEASDLDSAIPRASEFDMTAESEPLNIAHFATPTSPLNVGPVPYMQWVRVDKRVIDRSYQRSISRAGSVNIARIAEYFEWSKFSPVIVAPIEGGLFSIGSDVGNDRHAVVDSGSHGRRHPKKPEPGRYVG